MRPFSISPKCKTLRDSYPEPSTLREAVTGIPRSDLISIIRLWFAEGIPFAFRDSPMVYESLRNWMGLRLDVNPRSITIIGSGRIGYSVSPPPKFGRRFDENSDLDFSVVDNRLFASIVESFFTWESDVFTEMAKPRSTRERILWDDNLQKLPDNISRGFVDAYKIPSWNRYQQIVKVQETLYLSGERLKVTDGAPKVKHVSLRVYKNWDAFFSQVTLNMSLSIAKIVGGKVVTHELPPRTLPAPGPVN